MRLTRFDAGDVESVAVDVPDDVQAVRLGVDEPRGEATTEQVPDTSVAVVEPGRVLRGEPLWER